jgi:hypothetical protein
MQDYCAPVFIMVLTAILCLLCTYFAIKRRCEELKSYALAMLSISFVSMLISLFVHGTGSKERYCLLLSKNAPEYKSDCLSTDSYCQAVVNKEILLSSRFCRECIWGEKNREKCQELLLSNLSSRV